jgi:hypothetical protein
MRPDATEVCLQMLGLGCVLCVRSVPLADIFDNAIQSKPRAANCTQTIYSWIPAIVTEAINLQRFEALTNMEDSRYVAMNFGLDVGAAIVPLAKGIYHNSDRASTGKTTQCELQAMRVESFSTDSYHSARTMWKKTRYE